MTLLIGMVSVGLLLNCCEGVVSVDGQLELRKTAKIRAGSVVSLGDVQISVVAKQDSCIPVMPSKRKRLKLGELATLPLLLEQVDLIMEYVVISEHLLSIIYTAKVSDNVVRIKATLADLDQLSKYVENAASDTKDTMLKQELGAIFDTIRKLLQTYYGIPLRVVVCVAGAGVKVVSHP